MVEVFQIYIQHQVHHDHFHQKWIIFSITFEKWHCKHSIIVYWCNYCSIVNNIMFHCILDNNIVTTCYVIKFKINIIIILTWFIIVQLTNIFLFLILSEVFLILILLLKRWVFGDVYKYQTQLCISRILKKFFLCE